LTRKSERSRAALLEVLLRESREELIRADGKASILLASAGIIIGAVVAAILADEWNPSDLTCVRALLWWTGVVLALGGVACLGYAVYPQTKRRKKTPHLIAYYGDVMRFDHDEDLVLALDRTASDPDARSLDQVRVISGIVATKYRCIRYALVGFAFAAAILVLTAVTD